MKLKEKVALVTGGSRGQPRRSWCFKTTWFWAADFCHASPEIPTGSTVVAGSRKDLIYWYQPVDI